MIFDRSAITRGRRIQDFGLCDTDGVYQTSTKLRAKGWLVVTFFSPDEAPSARTVDKIQEWAGSLPTDKVSIVGVYRGEKSAIGPFAQEHGVTFPLLWDLEDYNIGLWGLTSLPTTFVVDAAGAVAARIVGDNTAELNAAGTALDEAIKRAAEAAQAAEAATAAAAAPPPASAPAAPAATAVTGPTAPPSAPKPPAAKPVKNPAKKSPSAQSATKSKK